MKNLHDVKADELLFGVEVFGIDEEISTTEAVLLYTKFFKSVNAMAGFYKQLSGRHTGVCILADKYGNKLGGC